MRSRVLRVAIAPREAIIRYTREIVAGRRRRSPDDPDVWFTSLESFAKILSDKNRALLALIAERRTGLDRGARNRERPREEQSFAHTAHNGAIWLSAARKEPRAQGQTGGDFRASGAELEGRGMTAPPSAAFQKKSLRVLVPRTRSSRAGCCQD